MKWEIGVLGGLVFALAACGGGSAPTAPSQPVAPPAVSRPADLPPHIFGAFASSEDVPDAAANGGNVVLVIPSYADDALAVGAALRANGKVAILSAHHVFGNHESTWEAGWTQTKAWAAPFAELIAAVYVVDEPLWNGIPPATRDRAIARVRADGYRTMVADWVEVAVRSPRAPSDLYGATCYSWPGDGSWSMSRCEEAYRTHPEWNIVIGQGYDVYEGGRKGDENGDTASQVARWAQFGRAREGILFWVWRWPGQVGIGDDPALRAAYHKAAGW